MFSCDISAKPMSDYLKFTIKLEKVIRDYRLHDEDEVMIRLYSLEMKKYFASNTNDS